jgi:hypothetical protein
MKSFDKIIHDKSPPSSIYSSIKTKQIQMKKISILVLSILFINFESNCQITKGNWLFGGNISFSSIKSSSDLGSNTLYTFQASGNAAYFFIDKFVAGIKPNIYIDHGVGLQNFSSTNSSLGPFLRYYFLPTDVRTNLFAESSYAYGTSSVSNSSTSHSNIFSFAGGPIFFLNPSVGLELTVSYTLTKAIDEVHSRADVIKAGIGLQFHLEKE